MLHIFHLILDILIFFVFYFRYCFYEFVGESKKEECRHFIDKNQDIKEKIIIKTLLIEMIKVQNLKTPIHGSVP